MKLYHYDRISRVILGESDAAPDPADPGQWIVPAFSTKTTPLQLPATHINRYNPDKKAWEGVSIVELQRAQEDKRKEDAKFSEAERWRSVIAGGYAALQLEHANFSNLMARGQGFESMADAMTYCDEPANPELQAKALALRAWRSTSRAKVQAMSEAAETGTALPADLNAFAKALGSLSSASTSVISNRGLTHERGIS